MSNSEEMFWAAFLGECNCICDYETKQAQRQARREKKAKKIEAKQARREERRRMRRKAS